MVFPSSDLSLLLPLLSCSLTNLRMVGSLPHNCAPVECSRRTPRLSSVVAKKKKKEKKKKKARRLHREKHVSGDAINKDNSTVRDDHYSRRGWPSRSRGSWQYRCRSIDVTIVATKASQLQQPRALPISQAGRPRKEEEEKVANSDCGCWCRLVGSYMSSLSPLVAPTSAPAKQYVDSGG